MWIIYFSSSRKWGTITSLGKKSRKTNKLYPLVPFLLSLSLLSFLWGSRSCPTACWQTGKDSGRRRIISISLSWLMIITFTRKPCYRTAVTDTSKSVHRSLWVQMWRQLYKDFCASRETCTKFPQEKKWKRSGGVGVRKKSGYQTSAAFSSLLEATLAAANITLLNLQLNCLRSSCINSGSRFWKGRIMCGINKTLCSFKKCLTVLYECNANLVLF